MPPNFFRIRLGEELRCVTGVYLKRWYIETPFFSLRIHHWLSGDDNRNFHDHPWSFFSLIVKGSYEDVSPNGRELSKVGSIRFRSATHKHYVEVAPNGCWSLLITGPRIRRWGFWIRNNTKFMKANKYFLTFGDHACR